MALLSGGPLAAVEHLETGPGTNLVPLRLFWAFNTLIYPAAPEEVATILL
jgi:hypothetical protein